VATGGKEVGKVSIRVVPELGEFRREMKAALEDYDKLTVKVDADLTKFNEKLASVRNFDVTAKVNADKDQFDRAIRDADKDFSVDGVVDLDAKPDKATKSTSEAFKKLKPEVEPKAKLDRFQQRYLSKIQKLISEVEYNIPLTAKGEGLRDRFKKLEKSFTNRVKLLDLTADEAELSSLRAGVDSFYNGIRNNAANNNLLNRDNAGAVQRAVKSIQEFTNIDLGIKVNSKAIEKTLADNLAASEKTWKDFDVKVGIKVDGEGEKAVITRLNKFRRDRIKIPVEFQDKFDYGGGVFRGLAISVARLKDEWRSASSGIGSALSDIGQSAASAGKSFLSMGRTMLIVVAVAALLAPAMALLSGILVTIPALLAGILVPVGAVALGLDGIKKAAESIKPQFEELKKVMSDSFQQGFTPIFKNLADNLLPTLKASLPSVANGVTSLFKAFSDTATTPDNLSKIDGTIRNIGAALNAAAPGVAAFTNGLINLVNRLSGTFLGGLAESFSNIGKEFDAWVTKVAGNGQLDAAMQNLKSVLGQIWDLVVQIASWGFDNLSDPNFGDGMKKFLDAVKEFVTNTLPSLADGFKTIAGLLDTLSPLFKLINLFNNGANIVKDTLGAMGDGNFEKPIQSIDQLNNRMKEVAKNGGSFVDQISAGAFGSGDPFANLPKQAEDAGKKVNSAFTNSFNQSGLKPGDAAPVQGVLGGPQQLAQAQQAGQQTAQNFITGLQTAAKGDVAGGVQQIQQALIPQTQTLVPQAQQSGQQIGQGLNQGIKDAVSGTGGNVTNNLQGVLSQQLQAVAVQAQGALAPLQQLAPQVSAAFGPAISAVLTGVQQMKTALTVGLVNLAQPVAGAFQSIAAGVSIGFSAALQATATGVAGILQTIQAGLSALPGVVQAMFGAVPAVIQGAMGQAIGTVANVCGQIIQTMLSYAGGAEQAGVAIGASFAKGIASQAGLVASSASALMEAARAFFPNSPADKGPFSGSGWIDKSGEAIARDFGGGIEGGIGQVVGVAKLLMQQVKDVFGNASGVVFNFNFGQQSAAPAFTAANNQMSQLNNTVSDFKTNVASTPLLGDVSPGGTQNQLKGLTQELSQLEIQRKQLELQRSQDPKNQGLKDQLEQIRLRKLELGLQKNQLDYANKYGGAQNGTTNAYADQIKKLEQMPTDFAGAVGNQFMSDLGWSGQGAIPSLMKQGFDMGSKFVFNVANMDDALSAQNRLQNQQYTGALGR